MPGAEFHALWGSDAVASLPFNEQAPKAKGWFPPAGGFRFHMVTLGPDSGPPPPGVDLDAGIAEISQKLPGIVEDADPGNPGMHTSQTVDFVVVLWGEAWEVVPAMANARQQCMDLAPPTAGPRPGSPAANSPSRDQDQP